MGAGEFALATATMVHELLKRCGEGAASSHDHAVQLLACAEHLKMTGFWLSAPYAAASARRGNYRSIGGGGGGGGGRSGGGGGGGGRVRA